MDKNFLNELQSLTECQTNQSLKNYTTFKLGGNAKYLCFPKNITQIIDIIKFLNKNNEKFIIIGNGSNCIFSDKGYNGTVIVLKNNFNKISINNEYVTAQAGVNLTYLAKYVSDFSLSGLEFAYGIPASVGGAVYMNAGAYDGEIKDVLKSVSYLDEECNVIKKDSKDLDLSYRHSIFHNKNYIILEAEFKLIKSPKNLILDKMNDLMNRRQSKQPLEYPSAGSTFKRPQGHFAARLIDECNLKGKKIGGASVSDKHCGFIINENNATTEDVLNLIEYVKNCVYNKTNVKLECEVRIIDN